MVKVQPTLLRRLNERRVLEVIQQAGPMSRAELCKASHLSAPTVSKTVAALLRARLIEEEDLAPTAPGRPTKMLRLARDSAQVLGVVVGVRRSWVFAAGLDGQFDTARMTPFPTPGSYAGLLETLVELARGLIQATPAPTLGIGVSIPGLLNRREQRTVISPNLHQTDGHTLGLDLQAALSLETVTLQECYALCLAERNYGAARGLNDFAMLDLTEGLGLGVYANGVYIDGHSGMGGELGHVTIDPRGKLCGCGNHGCLETVATDVAMAAALAPDEAADVEALLADVQQGVRQPTPAFLETLEYLAIGMAMVINIFNPTHLFVHSRFLDTSDWVYQQVVELTRRRALAPQAAECQLIRARGSKRQGAVAGIIHHLTSARGPSLDR